ncbi:MAG: hypothetical protein H0U75_01005 [Legionella sp.]|nr:hypothetical protein [Legionella sp.]
MSVFGKSEPGQFSRTHILEDKPMPPFVLEGFNRKIYLFVYLLVVAFAILGCSYSIYLNPKFAIIGLFFCYMADNFLFAIFHLRLHGLFIELPEHKMNVFEHHSFIHHYRNIKVYHEHWLETRIAYFIDPRAITTNRLMFLYKIHFNILTSVLLGILNPIIGITYFSGILATNLLQSTIHEWYHNPIKNRKNFYNPILFIFLSGLEKIKIASSKRHLRHHKHNLSNLDKAESWMDLYTPAGEWLANKLWKRILTKYVPGEYNMTIYMTKFYEFAIILVQILLPISFIVSFYLVGR